MGSRLYAILSLRWIWRANQMREQLNVTNDEVNESTKMWNKVCHTHGPRFQFRWQSEEHISGTRGPGHGDGKL